MLLKRLVDSVLISVASNSEKSIIYDTAYKECIASQNKVKVGLSKHFYVAPLLC